MTRQFRVLYRDVLFSIVDRDLLSTHARGDASTLLLQIVSLLVCLSVCLCVPVLVINVDWPAQGRLSFAWGAEHFLIATTMLVVGIVAVLSWDRMFPSHQDVMVLGPLPVRPQTILGARLAAVTTAMGVALLALHAAAGLVWPLALNGLSRGRPIHTLPLTYTSALPPVTADDLQGVLDRDLASAISGGMLAPGAAGGVSIGIYQRGVRRFVSYGAAAPDSIFQIGSVSKPFAGLLLADMVERGLARLDEPVRELIPAARLPAPVRREITLLDLVTHHSGLPGIPPRFRPADPANPAADFDVARLYAYLAARGVEKRPDAAFAYSNLGFGLLGHALSARAGVDYATVLRQVITGPLGMADTVVQPSPEQLRRVIQGYDDDRRPIPAWDFDVLAPAGGLRSTAPDLLAWLEANLHSEQSRAPTLSAALASSRQVRASMDSRTDIALAWMVQRDSGLVGHGGSLLAFTADVFFDPKEDLAVVVLSNVGPGTAISADVLGEHIRARLAGSPALSLAEVTIPATGGVREGLRLLVAYWFTMATAALFIFGLAVSVQGIAAALLPRRHLLRASPWLQLAMFCLVVGVYFLQPMLPRPATILAAQGGGLPGWSPSYWFLGMFQQMNGSPALAPLARNAWIGLGVVVIGSAMACALSYARTLRQIAEQPDVGATRVRARRLPTHGASLETAIAQFGIRTLLRSARHRAILAFYWGLAIVVAIIFLKTPRGQQLAEVAGAGAWHETSVPLLVSSIVMMAFAVLAARLAFAMPRELEANWIFRLAPTRDCARRLTSARRWALIAVSAAPVSAIWAVALFSMWPWQPVLAHVLALVLLGAILVEIGLTGAAKIPCTCSYLPGKSHVNLAVLVAFVVGVPFVLEVAEFEREALLDPTRSYALLGVLGLIWLAVRWRTARLAKDRDSQPTFDDEPADRILTLDLWDSRFRHERAAPTAGTLLKENDCTLTTVAVRAHAQHG